MKPREDWTIATQIVALVLTVAIPLLAFSVYLIYRDSVQYRSLAATSSLNSARNVVAATQEFLDMSQGILRQLAAHSRSAANGRPECDPLMHSYYRVLPRYSNIVLLDKHGTLVCSATEFKRSHFNSVGGTRWFQNTIHSNKEVLSEPRLGQVDGKWISTLSRAMRTSGGAATGVILLAIRLTDVQPFPSTLHTSPHSVAGIVSRDGTVVAYSVDSKRWIGKQLDQRTLSRVAAGKYDITLRAEGVDGVARIYSFLPVANTPWIAFAGVPVLSADAEAMRHLLALSLVSIVVLLTASVAAMGLGKRIVEPIRRIAATAHAVANGQRRERAPIIGAHEIRDVATEFNRMLDVRECAEKRLLNLAARLRSLSQRLVEAEELERRSITRELHDRTTQNLAVVGLHLRTIRANLPSTCPPVLDERLSDAQALLETTIMEVRDIMANLRPPALDEYGLLAALRTFTESLAARADIKIDVEGDEILPRPPLATETALFRIAQEALMNAAKHAHPNRVSVNLSASRQRIELTVADDGVGCTADAPPGGKMTWGLMNMRERAEAIGADFDIQSSFGMGTRISVAVKCEPT